MLIRVCRDRRAPGRKRSDQSGRRASANHHHERGQGQLDEPQGHHLLQRARAESGAEEGGEGRGGHQRGRLTPQHGPARGVKGNAVDRQTDQVPQHGAGRTDTDERRLPQPQPDQEGGSQCPLVARESAEESRPQTPEREPARGKGQPCGSNKKRTSPAPLLSAGLRPRLPGAGRTSARPRPSGSPRWRCRAKARPTGCWRGRQPPSRAWTASAISSA
jgi:hypothetical protein